MLSLLSWRGVRTMYTGKSLYSHMGVSFTVHSVSDGLIDGEYLIESSYIPQIQKEIETLLDKWPYPVERPDTPYTQIEVWMARNCNHSFNGLPSLYFKRDTYRLYISYIFFQDETDAMAFKLAWS